MTQRLAPYMAAEVRAESARRRVSGRELARRVEQPPATVARWLRGDSEMTIDDVYAVAEALDVDPVRVFEAAIEAKREAELVATDRPQKESNLQHRRRSRGVRHQGLEPRTRWFGAEAA